MDRGAWRVTVHGVTELDMTEQLTYTHIHVIIQTELIQNSVLYVINLYCISTQLNIYFYKNKYIFSDR